MTKQKGLGRKKITPRYKRPVSIKSAEKILRDYYRKKNRRNMKKATRSLRKNIGSKKNKKHTLRSKSSRSHLYRHRPYSKKLTGPSHYDMHGLDNKHRNYKSKRVYKKLGKYTKKSCKKYGRPTKRVQRRKLFIKSVAKAIRP